MNFEKWWNKQNVQTRKNLLVAALRGKEGAIRRVQAITCKFENLKPLYGKGYSDFLQQVSNFWRQNPTGPWN